MLLNTEPIFVRGLSRSGGTLMVTLLDAHPDISMSYEFYPNLLEIDESDANGLLSIAQRVEKSWNLNQAARCIGTEGLSKFVLRCPRSGIDYKTFAMLLRQHVDEGLDFQDNQGRMRFIERCCRYKMKREGKSRWGVKCTPRFDLYLEVWQNAYFLNMIRDGRDVLASQLNTGNFQTTPTDLGRSWSKNHFRFRELVDNPTVNTLEVYYEKLVQSPENICRHITNFLEVPFDSEMLHFYNMKLTIYDTNHLSRQAISQPINSGKIGRWKKDLTSEQIEQFCQSASKAMKLLGFSENE